MTDLEKNIYTKRTYDREVVLPKVDEYLKQCVDTWEMVGSNGNAKAMRNVKLPSKVGLSRFLGIGTSTLTRWCNDFAELEAKVEEVIDGQHETLLNSGLGGQYNPTITKLLLGKHGYADQQNQNINANVEGFNIAIENAFNRANQQTDGSPL